MEVSSALETVSLTGAFDGATRSSVAGTSDGATGSSLTGASDGTTSSTSDTISSGSEETTALDSGILGAFEDTVLLDTGVFELASAVVQLDDTAEDSGVVEAGSTLLSVMTPIKITSDTANTAAPAPNIFLSKFFLILSAPKPIN